jgi:archaellum biogenesis ATPase FlaH
MAQLSGLFLVIIIALSTFTYLPEDVVCKLDDSCDVIVTTSTQTVDNNQQNKVILSMLADGVVTIRNIVNPMEKD